MTTSVATDAWRLGHRPPLDGLRGIAVLSVVAGHVGVPFFVNGGAVGVNLFFTLSGFLITSLLLEERTRNGRLAFGAFYLRRALRLLPALVVVVAGVWVLNLMLDLYWVTPEASIAALFYATNFWILHESSGVLGHTWSLSLEEQFYLTWPLALALLFRVGRHRAVLVASVVLGSLSIVQLFRVADIPGRTFSPDSRSFCLLFGCALAAALTGAARVRVPSRAIAVAAVLLLAFSVQANGGLAADLAIPATTAGTVLAVWYAGTRRSWLLERPLLRWTGQRSYAIYLWHFPVWLLILKKGWGAGAPWPVHLVVVGGMSVLLAMVSWRYVEQPFLRLKDRTAAARPREAIAVDDRA